MESIKYSYQTSANKLSSDRDTLITSSCNFFAKWNWKKLSSSATMPLLSVALTLAVLGVAEQALAVQRGDDGQSVSNIQRCLKKLGYFNSSVTGKFATRTQEAVIRFQRANELRADGVVGNKTQQVLQSQCQSRIPNSNVSGGLRRGSTGPSVRRLQQDLQRLGYFNSNITGYFGSETEQAVSRFQQAYRIRPDGVVGTRTREAIRISLNQPNYPPNNNYPVSVEPNYPPSNNYPGSVEPNYPPSNNYPGSVEPNYPGSTGGSVALNPGDSGQEVRELQEDLRRLGYFNPNPTGYYGPTTQEAVERFQQSYGLTRNGIADSRTIEAISDALTRTTTNPTNSDCSVNRGEICLGETSQRVEIVQRRLQELRFFEGRVSGNYGPATRNAVVQFQQSRRLEQSGFVNFQTWQALGLSNIGNSSNPNNPGNSTGWTPGRENRYVVVVPIRNYDTLNQVRQYVPYAFQADSRLGTYVNAGQYSSRSDAEKQSKFLRSQGLDARVEYF